MAVDRTSEDPAPAEAEIRGDERAFTPGSVSTDELQRSETLRLPGVCTFAEVAPLRRLLLEQLAGEGDLLVDASAVERIDTAGLQLLVAFVRDRGAAGRTTTWSERSAAFEAAVSRLGLDRLLASGG